MLTSLFFTNCTADQLPEPQPPGDCGTEPVTYLSDIADIIDRSCAYSGCHLDSAPGVYDSYEGLLGVLQSGLFKERVVTIKDDPNLGMPPDFAVANRPKDLTTDELSLIRCWLEDGFPKQ